MQIFKKNYLLILWLVWCLVAVILVQIIGHSEELLKAYQWCGAGIIIGAIYTCYLMLPIPLQSDNKFAKISILVLVLLTHFFFWYANPIKEDDYFRYSWDGRNSRLGEHPYLNPPEHYFSYAIPAYAQKINHPDLRTIYSPIAQVLFLSEGLYPDTIYGWWVLILIADISLVIFTWLCLSKRNIHWQYFAVVWLNPIWLKEGLNSGHLDIMVAIFIWLAVFFSIKGSVRHNYISIFFASLSAGIRPYLGIISLNLIRQKQFKLLLIFLILFFLPWVLLLSIPHAPPIQEALSSWFVFVKRWDFNSLFFDFFYRINKNFNGQENLARISSWVFGLIAMGILYWKTRFKTDTIFWGCLSVAVWLLFQPTANAWYFLPCLGASGAYLLCNNVSEKHYKGVLSACAIALPMSYMHYQYLDYTSLGYIWALGELLLLILTYLLFTLKNRNITIQTNL